MTCYRCAAWPCECGDGDVAEGWWLETPGVDTAPDKKLPRCPLCASCRIMEEPHTLGCWVCSECGHDWRTGEDAQESQIDLDPI